MTKHDEELDEELQDPKLQADTRDLDFGCGGCLIVLLICLVGIVLLLLISPGRGLHRFWLGG